MPTYRCSICAINYPVQSAFTTCKVCEDKTSYISNAKPHEDWAAMVARRTAEADDMPGIIDLGDQAVVLAEDGELFLPAMLAYRAGLRAKMADGQLFSLLAFGERLHYEVLGWDEPRRRWWVRAFELEWPVDDDGKAYVPEEWVT